MTLLSITLTTVSSSVDIPLSEGPVNLNWGPIMKTINEDPYDSFQQGGWSFPGGAGGGEEVRSCATLKILTEHRALPVLLLRFKKNSERR